jgi:cell division protein FtsI (penicillin-binding protein 3)
VQQEDGTMKKVEKDAGQQVIKKSTADQLLEMLEQTVLKGNVIGVSVPGYRIGGKTGTAEIAGAGGSLSNIMASFIGVFPTDNPQYAVGTFYMNAHSAYLGALSAAPVANQIITFLASHYSVPTSKPAENPLPPTTW